MLNAISSSWSMAVLPQLVKSVLLFICWLDRFGLVPTPVIESATVGITRLFLRHMSITTSPAWLAETIH
jgi:hypothetical protein